MFKQPVLLLCLFFGATIKSEKEVPFRFLNNSNCTTNECKGSVCLKNVETCMEEDKEYPRRFNLLDQHILSMAPAFDISKVKGISAKCKEDVLKYMADLKSHKLWALKMLDANSKLPSGILSGNINQLGDFDECLSVKSDGHDIKGQYCLAALKLEIPDSPYLAALHRLVHSHYVFKSDNVHAYGHQLATLSTIHWAVCTPHSCTSKDVKSAIKEYVDQTLGSAQLTVDLKLEPIMCQTLNRPVPWPTILASGLLLVFVIFTLAASVYDLYEGTKNEYLLAFSIPKNIRALLSLERPSNDIKVVHGVRFLNVFLLLIGHTAMVMFFMPYTNRTQTSELMGKSWSVVVRTSSLYTDTFLMISGTLASYSLIGKLQRRGKISIMEECLSRLCRIIPVFAFAIFLMAFVLPWVSSGPLWNEIIFPNSDLCKKYWWRNLLFIHNYFEPDAVCLLHSHHIGTDTQLYIATVLIMPIIWKWPKRGLFTLVVLGIIGTAMRYYTAYVEELSTYLYFGITHEKLINTGTYLYMLPSYRSTVYIIGILLGILLNNSQKIKLTRFHINIGNFVAFLCFCVSYFGPAYMGDIDYIYHPKDAAWYASIVPVLWCLSFAWIIFTSYIGESVLIDKLFSSRFFLITTRISYSFYLAQYPLLFYNVGTKRTPDVFSVLDKLVNLNQLLSIFLVSIAVTILVELPFLTLRNIVLKKEVKPTDKGKEAKLS